MREITDDRVTKLDGKFVATCVCGKTSTFAQKHSALKMLDKGHCRHCKRDYRSTQNEQLNIYKNADGKWCSTCSGCGIEQAYKRKDHAKQSEVADWQCKSCVAESKGFAENQPVGDKTRVYRKFKNAANSRGVKFALTEEEFFADYTGACSLTGWPIGISYKDQSASVDRIDNNKGYEVGNIQWVHTMVNMCRGKRELSEFIRMCKAVAEHAGD